MRRRKLGPWIIVAVIAASAIARPSRGASQCPVHGQPDPQTGNFSGSSSIITDSGNSYGSANGMFELFATGTDESPVGHADSVDFDFSFYQDSGVGGFVLACRNAPWSLLAAGKSISLRDLCGHAAGDAGADLAGAPAASLSVHTDEAGGMAVFDLDANDGTVLVDSKLDANGNGTISLTLDLPAASLTSTSLTGRPTMLDGAPPSPVTFQLSTTHLVGMATYVDSASNCNEPGGCDSCGNTDSQSLGG